MEIKFRKLLLRNKTNKNTKFIFTFTALRSVYSFLQKMEGFIFKITIVAMERFFILIKL